ncbi:LysR family transcriptional regulator [Pseudonocardia xinjiangensis]|uniref:LysR family transcriptional regulator n=1 Tax=Pseudonocardia xinjiangensis TaxID=75289 RepID=UPI003D91C9C1
MTDASSAASAALCTRRATTMMNVLRHRRQREIPLPTIGAIYAAAVTDRRRIADVDLNLLLALEALIVERNVTRAARRLGRSQPTLSSALARLRRHFGDELLIRGPGGYRLTPFAAAIADDVITATESVDRALGITPAFDPRTSQREFTLMMSDYVMHTLGPLLARDMLLQAPRTRLRLLQISESITVDHGSRLREVDGWVLPPGFVRSTPHTSVYTDSWVCIAPADGTGLGEQLSLDEMRQASWLQCFRHQPEVVPILHDLQLYGRNDVATVVVESFMVAPALVAATTRLAIVPARIAAASTAPIRILPLPRPLPPLVQNLWWDATYERDPAHRWLRETVTACGRKLDDA